MDFFALDPLLQILIAVVLLAGIWTLIRLLLRLARRVLACGCVIFLLGGGILVFLNVASRIVN
jgi:hypothetical protein